MAETYNGNCSFTKILGGFFNGKVHLFVSVTQHHSIATGGCLSIRLSFTNRYHLATNHYIGSRVLTVE